MRRTEQEGHQGVGATPQERFRKKTASQRNQNTRYEKSFNGYCFSCSQFGHKALNCRSHERRSVGSPNNSVKCWTCKCIGHIASYCRAMRCYGCSGFGHKAQDCYNSRRQQMRNAPYSLTRNFHESWKENDVERMKSKRTGVEDKGHPQTWMKKTEQLNIDQVDDCDSDVEEGCHVEF